MTTRIRKSLVSGFAAALVAGLSALPASAAEEVYELKFATFTPEPAAETTVFRQYAKEWEEKSNGRLKVTFFFGSSMGPMPKHYEFVRNGVADVAYFQHGVTPGRFPLTELIHLPYVLPEGVKGTVAGGRILTDLADEYLNAEHQGVKVIWLATTRPAHIYDREMPIRTVADLKGRRYRAPTQAISTMLKDLGANPIGLPAPLMAEALQKATIDGVITDEGGIFNFKLGGLVKHRTPMFSAVLSFGLVMNEDTYNDLPPDLRKIIDDSSGGSERAGRNAVAVWGETPKLTGYIDAADINDVPLDPAADAEMRKLADAFIEKRLQALESDGLPAREVYAKMKALSAKYAK